MGVGFCFLGVLGKNGSVFGLYLVVLVGCQGVGASSRDPEGGGVAVGVVGVPVFVVSWFECQVKVGVAGVLGLSGSPMGGWWSAVTWMLISHTSRRRVLPRGRGFCPGWSCPWWWTMSTRDCSVQGWIMLRASWVAWSEESVSVNSHLQPSITIRLGWCWLVAVFRASRDLTVYSWGLVRLVDQVLKRGLLPSSGSYQTTVLG